MGNASAENTLPANAEETFKAPVTTFEISSLERKNSLLCLCSRFLFFTQQTRSLFWILIVS